MPRRPSSRACLAVLALGACLWVALPQDGHAKDGGSSGGGSGNNGHGSSNSGHGGGGDDGGGHGGRDDDGGESGNSGRGGGISSGPGPGRSGDWDNSGSGDARRAVSGGKALPLARVMPVVRKVAPGQVLEVDLQRAVGGSWVYKFLVLSSGGAYREVTVDALGNRVIRVRER